MTGARGVVGTSAVRALVASGHDVSALARTSEEAEHVAKLAARPVLGDPFDHVALVAMFADRDVVCNFATRVPVGYPAVRAGAWREHDRLMTSGVKAVVAAARASGVRRIVHGSESSLYADNGDDWIDEQSPVGITAATEPASVGEAHVQGFVCDSRHGVVLRFGALVGGDETTRWVLRAVRHGRPIGLGDPAGWAHVVHTDDIGPAVLLALGAPSGTYNVGAEPVRRSDLVQGYATAAGADRGAFLGGILRRLVGERLEPMTRSLRVSSEHFMTTTGWVPRRPVFDASWFDAAETESEVLR